MAFKITPIEKRNGQLRVNWIQLVVWTLAFNLVLFLWIKYQIGPTKHPVSVVGQQIVVYSMASDTAQASSVIGTVEHGSVLDLHTVQPDGWCRVSLPEEGFPRIYGYVQKRFLVIPEATLDAAKKGQLQ